MKEFAKALVANLSPSTYESLRDLRDFIRGAGQAYDPIPRCYHRTFTASDLEALTADYEALLLDWFEVSKRLPRGVGYRPVKHHRPMEVSHHWNGTTGTAGRDTGGGVVSGAYDYF